MLLYLLQTILYFLLTLAILISFHEYGHYLAAKCCGVRVDRFSIGFGPPIISKKFKGTEFILAWIPLGGYVKMFGDTGGVASKQLDQSEWAQSFDHKLLSQRMVIVAAGPLANFLLALLFFWVLALPSKTALLPVVAQPPQHSVAATSGLKALDEIIRVDGVRTPTWEAMYQQLIERIGDSGTIELQVRPFDSGQSTHSLYLPINRWLSKAEQPDPMSSLGLALHIPEHPVVLGGVLEGSRAQQAGLLKGDRLVRVNQEPINHWEEWRQLIRNNPEQPLHTLVKRKTPTGELDIELELIPQLTTSEGKSFGQVGVTSAAVPLADNRFLKISYTPWQAIGVALKDTWHSISFTLMSIKKIVFGQLSMKALGGPITIAQYAGDSARYGWQPFFRLLALLSVSLGVLNLLPIPMLDGGRLAFYSYELVMGKPLNTKFQEYFNRAGILLLICLIGLVFFNDISRLR